MKKIIVKFILLPLTIFILADYSYAAESDGRKLLELSALRVVGGFKIPRVNINGVNYASLYLDILPSNHHWIGAHTQQGYLVEFIEPAAIGTGAPSTWPALTQNRTQPALQSTDKISPFGVFWLDANTVLTSGRKSYRSGFAENWLSVVDMSGGGETLRNVRSVVNTENDNFHVLQALGAGFVRISGTAWSARYAFNSDFLLGRGGYDVLGSPLGPAMAYWDQKSENISWYMDFPTDHPDRRDSQYNYPSLDPNTYEKAQLPIWKEPDAGGGYWQAGDVGGITYIDHPEYTGFLVTHNYGRGVHDYRAQSDCGSGKFFLVADPSVFYSKPKEGTCAGNRGYHQEETLNAAYPRGTYARIGRVYSPDQIAEIAAGTRNPWDTNAKWFEWPKSNIDWVEADESPKNPTLLGSVTWDRSRNYLWAVIGNSVEVYLVAYELSTTSSICSDGLKNQNETEIDCGGVCDACAPVPTTYNLSNFISLIDNWLGIGNETSDVNSDSVVDTRDLGIIMSGWE